MGYTHYWYLNRHAAQAQWSDALVKVAQLVRESPVPLAGGLGTGDPELGDSAFRFNGQEPDDYETFDLPVLLASLADERRSPSSDEEPQFDAFNFTKTEFRPYDIVVVGVLAALEHYAPDVIRVSSDGTPEEWAEGIEFARSTLGDPTIGVPRRVAADE